MCFTVAFDKLQCIQPSVYILQIEALSVEGEVSEEQQQVLSGLEDRVNQAIELFEEDGAVVRVNER